MIPAIFWGHVSITSFYQRHWNPRFPSRLEGLVEEMAFFSKRVVKCLILNNPRHICERTTLQGKMLNVLAVAVVAFLTGPEMTKNV